MNWIKLLRKDSASNIKKYRIEQSISYSIDLLVTLNYIKDQLSNDKASEKLFQLINEAIESLKTFPLSHPIIIGDFRRVIVNNYSIYYSVNERRKIVNISRLLYNGRDISKLQL